MANNNITNNRSYAMTSDTGITSTTGNITATLGDVVLTNGKLTLGVSTGTDGQVIIATTAGNPAWAALTAGDGVSVTNAAGSVTLASTAPFTWAQVGADAALTVNQGTVNSKVALLTMSLPAASAVNTVIKLVGLGAGGWTITQGANQQILVGDTNTTLGAGGTLSSTDAGDCLSMICTTTDLVWRVFNMVGNLTVV